MGSTHCEWGFGGNREQGTGNMEQGIRNRELVALVCYVWIFCGNVMVVWIFFVNFVVEMLMDNRR